MKYKVIISILLIIIGILTFSVVSVILFNDFLAFKENNSDTEKLIENVIEIKENTETSTDNITIDWEKLNQINSDIIAWIKIENTNIDYPILKSNNLFYINHSYNKKYNKNGSIFTTDNNPFKIQETTIYGHNMRNKSMFSELANYLKKDFLDANNIIKIYTPTGDYEGKIFSAYSISFDEENNNIKSLTFDEKIKYYKNASKYKVDNIDNISNILKLSTCSYINAKYTPTEQRYYILAALFPIS